MGAGEAVLKMGTPFELLALPTDLLRCALFGGTPLHELAPLLTSLRATNHQMLTFCCAVAGEVYDAVQARALSAVTSFPVWYKRNDQQLPVVPMEEWVTTFMTEARRVCLEKPDYLTKQLGIKKALGLESGSSMQDDGEYRDEQQELCYTLCCGADMKLWVEETRFVHVSLASVAEWFRLHGGWRLDACAALLFSRACARKMNAGSSWMVNDAHVDALECHALLVEVQAFVLQEIRMGREAELLGALRRAYGAGWTTMTHDKFYAILGVTGGYWKCRWHGSEGRSMPLDTNLNASGSAACPAALVADFRTLRTRLLDEVQVEAVQEETAAIFTRKINACLPTSLFRPI